MFKVVPDQLRISAGWVRCGVCGEVFDAPSQMLSEADGRNLESLDPFSAPAPATLAEAGVASAVSRSGTDIFTDDFPAGSSPSESEGKLEPFEPVPKGEVGPFGAFSEGASLNAEVGVLDTELAEGTGSPRDQSSSAPTEDARLLTDSPAPRKGPDRQNAQVADAPPIDDALSARLATATGLAEVEKEERAQTGLSDGYAPENLSVADESALPAERIWIPPAHLQAAIQNSTSPREPVHLELDEARQEEPDSPRVSVTPGNTDSPDAPDSTDPTDERWWPRAESGVGSLSADETVPGTEPVPSFVKQARRRAFFRSRGVRVVLWLVLTLLVLGLGLQWAVAQRNWLAATEPRLAPLLESICRPMGCIVSPYRNLSAIVIDGSSFQRVASDSFRLNVSLRNNGDLPVAPPSLELILTDAQDQVLLRRVVSADEMSAPQTLSAQGEFNGSSAVSVEASDPSAIVGYRLTAFYP